MITKRQKEVLSLIAKGETNNEISRSLHLSESTVRNHVRDIFVRLGCDNRVKATIYAYKSGLMNVLAEATLG